MYIHANDSGSMDICSCVCQHEKDYLPDSEMNKQRISGREGCTNIFARSFLRRLREFGDLSGKILAMYISFILPIISLKSPYSPRIFYASSASPWCLCIYHPVAIMSQEFGNKLEHNIWSTANTGTLICSGRHFISRQYLH